MRNLHFKISVFLPIICLLLTGCSDKKDGLSFYNESLGIRYLKSKDEKNVELDGFRFSKETIKSEIWEETFYLDKNAISSFETIGLGKLRIATPQNFFTIYDDHTEYIVGPRLPVYFGIFIPEIGFIDEQKQNLNIVFPSEIVINLHLEDEIFDSFYFNSSRMYELHFVISDPSAKDLCYSYKPSSSDPRYYEFRRDVLPQELFEEYFEFVLRFKIWLPQSYDYLNNNIYFKEYWDNDHYDLGIGRKRVNCYFYYYEQL